MFSELLHLWVQQVDGGIGSGLEGNIERIDCREKIKKEQIELGFITELTLDSLHSPMFLSI